MAISFSATLTAGAPTSTPRLLGNRKVQTTLVTFDSSYVTAGEPFTPQQLGMVGIESVVVLQASSTTTNSYIVQWNGSTTAPTLKVFQGDNANASAAPLIEVPNTTNLAALTAVITVTGW